MLQALAMPAEVQLTLEPDGTNKADELALNFDDVFGMNRSGRFPLTPKQTRALNSVDAALEDMSGPKPFWTEEALRTAGEWENVRSLAKEALRAFRWPIEVPQIGHVYTYTKDGRISSVTTIGSYQRKMRPPTE